ncbi:MAG: hypothetical protein WC076_03460 [Terrimicrobiaceae bacterium]|nr:hypothetical protein [Terrimicrobiaceae bacterium]
MIDAKKLVGLAGAALVIVGAWNDPVGGAFGESCGGWILQPWAALMEDSPSLAAVIQAAWARRLRVRGLPSLASARRSTAAGAKISRSSPARLMCQLM